MRDIAAGDEKASEVKRRMLDLEPWSIESYDLDTGQTVLCREHVAPQSVAIDSSAVRTDLLLSDSPALEIAEAAQKPASTSESDYTDQFDNEASGLPKRRDINGSSFVRSPEVRAAALRRARGLCQLCGQPGFMTVAGKIYLETHHVTPLCEGGRDVAANVVALCATDHRRAHFDAYSAQLRQQLLRIAAG